MSSTPSGPTLEVGTVPCAGGHAFYDVRVGGLGVEVEHTGNCSNALLRMDNATGYLYVTRADETVFARDIMLLSSLTALTPALRFTELVDSLEL